jgi:hypothetical protein
MRLFEIRLYAVANRLHNQAMMFAFNRSESFGPEYWLIETNFLNRDL